MKRNIYIFKKNDLKKLKKNYYIYIYTYCFSRLINKYPWRDESPKEKIKERQTLNEEKVKFFKLNVVCLI
jgi:hypothetical protein